jgi:hypothetical protein
MAFLVVSVHEMFYTLLGSCPWRATVAQIEHETRVARGEAAEPGGGHAGAAKEYFDLADQHGVSSGESLSAPRLAREILLV